jgi:hypothetical protein
MAQSIETTADASEPDSTTPLLLLSHRDVLSIGRTIRVKPGWDTKLNFKKQFTK